MSDETKQMTKENIQIKTILQMVKENIQVTEAVFHRGSFCRYVEYNKTNCQRKYSSHTQKQFL